jgi:histidinol phosphatase-like PHP family hydrolase
MEDALSTRFALFRAYPSLSHGLWDNPARWCRMAHEFAKCEKGDRHQIRKMRLGGDSGLLVDMHVHTNISSRCSSVMPEELVERAKELGLDAVCVTEHSTFVGAQVNYEYARDHGFKVFRGLEVYTEQGDMLVFGWEARIRYYLFPFSDLVAEVEKRDGIIIPAHPCRGISDVRHRHRLDLDDEVRDAISIIETHNGAISRKSNEQAEKIRRKYGLFGVGGSDAHHASHIGRCLTVFEDDISDERELIGALRSGGYRPVYGEEIFGDEVAYQAGR